MSMNMHDPVFTVGCANFTINETTAVGTVITNVVGFDQDQGTILHYQISDLANSLQIYNNGSIYISNPFNLQSIGFSCGTLKCIPYIVQLFDHPNTSLDTTRATACSGFVSIIDADNNAPSFTSSVFNGAVYENASIGDVVKMLQNDGVGAEDLDIAATDIDTGFILRYSLVHSSLTAFEFDSDTLQVRTMLDYETVEEYSFDIIVRDTGSQNDTATVNIRVLDVNDNAPTFQQPTYSFTIEEGLNVGLNIGMVSASDNDSGQNQMFTYQIESANPNSSFFTINGITGDISVNSRVDREQYLQHELVVVAVDEGSPSLTGSTIVFINITTDSGKISGDDY